MISEADARILIDRLLEQAGWCITNKAHVSTEEAAADGRADYLVDEELAKFQSALLDKAFRGKL